MSFIRMYNGGLLPTSFDLKSVEVGSQDHLTLLVNAAI